LAVDAAVPKIPAKPTLLFGVGGVPKMPVEVMLGVALDVLLGLATLVLLAPDAELLVIVPVVPPSVPLVLLDVLVPKLPTPVVLVVKGVVRAFEVIAALVGRVSDVEAPAPPPPPPLVVVELVVDAADVTTPALVTLALGEVTWMFFSASGSRW